MREKRNWTGGEIIKVNDHLLLSNQESDMYSPISWLFFRLPLLLLFILFLNIDLFFPRILFSSFYFKVSIYYLRQTIKTIKPEIVQHEKSKSLRPYKYDHRERMCAYLCVYILCSIILCTAPYILDCIQAHREWHSTKL